MTHTETPWQVKHDWDAEGATTIVANVDGDTHADGTTSYTYDTIARCSDEFEELLPNAAANAARIVHCVNTHDALVKALEGLLDAFDCFANEVNWGASALSGSTISKVNEVPGTALAILTKAKGGAA